MYTQYGKSVANRESLLGLGQQSIYSFANLTVLHKQVNNLSRCCLTLVIY